MFRRNAEYHVCWEDRFWSVCWLQLYLLCLWQVWDTEVQSWLAVSESAFRLGHKSKLEKIGIWMQSRHRKPIFQAEIHVERWVRHIERIAGHIHWSVGLLQILDFAQNYLCMVQDVPQSLHWDHMQVVLHPIINHFINTDGKLACEEHIIISNDRRHAKFAVQAFENASFMSLKECLDIQCIYQFCDNCAGQYKSFGPFQFVSSSMIPLTHSYFGARHGKS